MRRSEELAELTRLREEVEALRLTELPSGWLAAPKADWDRLREENERLKAATSRPEAVLYWMDKAEAAEKENERLKAQLATARLRAEAAEAKLVEAQEKARLQQGMCDRREAELAAAREEAAHNYDGWQAAEKVVKRIDEQVRLETEAKEVERLKTDLEACSANAVAAVAAYRKRAEAAEAKLVEAQINCLCPELKEHAATYRREANEHWATVLTLRAELAAARAHHEASYRQAIEDIDRVLEQVRVLREALEGIVQERGFDTLKLPDSRLIFVKEIACRALFALRSSEEPAAKPLQPHPFEPCRSHPFEPCRSACWCGQPESAHKPEEPEAKPLPLMHDPLPLGHPFRRGSPINNCEEILNQPQPPHYCGQPESAHKPEEPREEP